MAKIIGHFAKEQFPWRKHHSIAAVSHPKGCGTRAGVFECDIKNVTCLKCLWKLMGKVTDRDLNFKVQKQYEKMKNIRDIKHLKKVYRTNQRRAK